MLKEYPEIKEYANACTLSVSYHCEDHDVAMNMNSKLQAIYEWGSQWQVRCVPNKTQAMITSNLQMHQPFTREFYLSPWCGHRQWSKIEQACQQDQQNSFFEGHSPSAHISFPESSRYSHTVQVSDNY